MYIDNDYKYLYNTSTLFLGGKGGRGECDMNKIYESFKLALVLLATNQSSLQAFSSPLCYEVNIITEPYQLLEP
jgi:hypothetical protein